VSNFRIASGAAALAVGVALVPGLAQAAGTPQAEGAVPQTFAAAHTSAPASSAFRTFSSPAAKSVRLPRAAAATRATAPATGTTIYAYSTPSCSTDPGDGTQANPYCLIQDAVNVAAPGDTIDVLGSVGYFSEESVTVRTSDISIVGIGGQAWIFATNSNGGKPALILDGVSNVTVSNLMLTSSSAPALQITGSSGVTVDSGYVSGGQQGVAIDGASSNVTLSRTYVDTHTWQPGAAGVSVAAGASNVTLASNVLAASGISATGVNGLNIAGNTIQRGCSAAIDVEGASTGVNIENNLLEDANPSTDYMMGGFPSQCATNGHTWEPDVTVAAGSSAATTADYNDFYVYGSDATAPYSWAGTSYPSIAAFQTATSQGAHDTNDTVEAGDTYFRANESDNVDATPRSGSAVVKSANASAPGQLSSDFYGHSPYTDRGAITLQTPSPNLAVALAARDTSAYGVSLNTMISNSTVPVSISIAWGDGTTTSTGASGNVTVTTPHTYAALGNYQVTVTVTDNQGDTVGNTVAVRTAGSEFTPYGPTRLLDTRYGTGVAKGKLAAGGTIKLQIAGTGTIPAGVTAAVLNLTVTGPSAAGFITAYGDGLSRPGTSNVNFTAGQTVPNLAIVPVGPDGAVDLYNRSGGSTDLVADIAGYFTQSPADGYTPMTPYRLLDTRSGTGAARAKVPAHGSVAVRVTGSDGGRMPSSGVAALALNMTVTNAQGWGSLTVYPDGQKAPLASNVNFGAGQTIANAAVSPVGSDGYVRVVNNSGAPTDVILDVNGYYSKAGHSAYLPTLPYRLLDTRDSSTWSYGPLPSSYYIYMPLSAYAPDISAFVLNTTVTDTKGTGYLAVAPDPNSLSQYQNRTNGYIPPPTVSTLNWLKGRTVPNLVQASTGANGIIDLWNRSSGSLDLVVDEMGFYQTD
jgi:hypothetical protein